MKLEQLFMESKSKNWVGVDLDGTIAIHSKHYDKEKIGEPIPAMVDRVKKWLKKGKNVKIFTARATNPEAHKYIKKWCKEHIGVVLPITCKKDRYMVALYDDRAIQVKKNTGKLVS